MEASAPTMLRRALSRSVVSRVITLARPQRPLLQPPWRALCSGASKGDGDGNDGNGKPPSDDSVLEAEPVEDVEEGTYGRNRSPQPGVVLSNREKIGMDQFVWDVPAWVVCPGEGVG